MLVGITQTPGQTSSSVKQGSTHFGIVNWLGGNGKVVLGLCLGFNHWAIAGLGENSSLGLRGQNPPLVGPHEKWGLPA